MSNAWCVVDTRCLETAEVARRGMDSDFAVVRGDCEKLLREDRT